KYIRYQLGSSSPRYGELDGTTVYPLDGELAAFRRTAEPPVQLGDVRLLAPAVPTKIIAVGPNYKSPFRGPNALPPMEMRFWTKPASVLNDPEGVIELPPGVPAVNHEVELAVVIGKRAKQVSPDEAADYIFGYSCLNEVCAGDFSTPGAFPASPYFIHGK